MVIKTKPVTAPPKEKKDWVPAAAVVIGGAGLALGLYLFLRKKGVSPGTKMNAHFTFDYSGNGGPYLLQVSLGHIRFLYFDHVEGLTWTQEVELTPEPASYAFDVVFTLPDGMTAGTYDAEALIRTSEMDWLDYFLKCETKSAVIVSE